MLAVTGIRSEYDILYPVIKCLRDHEDFRLRVVVSGAHLSENHGHTITKIMDDGFEVSEKIFTLLDTDSIAQRPLAISTLIAGLTSVVLREQPDLMLVVGDREESIAASIVGNYTLTMVAHIGGGDPVWGNADDPIRMAVSKLSHIHFTTSKQYARNLLSLGEDDWRICNIGTPGLDNIVNEPLIALREISASLKIQLDKYIVLIKHPLSSEVLEASNQMRVTLDAIQQFCETSDLKCIWIKSNGDPGSLEMENSYDRWQHDRILKTNSLSRRIFVNLIRNSLALVGNSSMGILEAPTYQIPVVNVGNRQQGRLNAGNVEFVRHERTEILDALTKACFDFSYRSKVAQIESPYGDGSASQKFLEFIQAVDFSDKKWTVKSCLIK